MCRIYFHKCQQTKKERKEKPRISSSRMLLDTKQHFRTLKEPILPNVSTLTEDYSFQIVSTKVFWYKYLPFLLLCISDKSFLQYISEEQPRWNSSWLKKCNALHTTAIKQIFSLISVSYGLCFYYWLIMHPIYVALSDVGKNKYDEAVLPL